MSWKRCFLYLLASGMVFSVAFQAGAKKKKKSGSITVINCSDKKKVMRKYKYKATVCIYNAGDTSKSTAKHRKTLIPGKSWKVRCQGKYWKPKLGKPWNVKVLKECKAYLIKEAGNACPVLGKVGGSRLKRVSWGRTVYVHVSGDKAEKLKIKTHSCPK